MAQQQITPVAFEVSPSERLEQLARALTALADDVLLTVQELREQEEQEQADVRDP